ncbi:MAG: hypothetical protein IBX71_10480 [Candidatus Desulforudis sp.]|nr:hypothetical protein [Desulforudis sp.]
MQHLVDAFGAAFVGNKLLFGIIVLLSVGMIGALSSNLAHAVFEYLRRKDEVLDEILDEALDPRALRK